jgi:hypothetical protein
MPTGIGEKKGQRKIMEWFTKRGDKGQHRFDWHNNLSHTTATDTRPSYPRSPPKRTPTCRKHVNFEPPKIHKGHQNCTQRIQRIPRGIPNIQSADVSPTTLIQKNSKNMEKNRRG